MLTYHRKLALLSLLVLGLLLVPAGAQEQGGKKVAKPEPGKEEPAKDGTGKEGTAKPEAGKEKLVRTRHEITINGKKLEYEATAGTLTIKDDDGKARANVFFVAYTSLDNMTPAKRPLTFAFNGGPGSSSVWLHLGVLGPRRIVLEEKGKSVSPPYHLTDNDMTLLDQTDLVFIDPVSTGYSRPAPGVDGKLFHGVQEDLDANGAFIRAYITRFKRWDSPKFLIGESYGTTRAAGLSEHLQDREGINLNGIVLVSTVLNFATLRFDEGNDLPYILYLPGYTATAWYHKKLSSDLQSDLQKALAESEKFALNEYTLALFKGSSLANGEKQQIAKKVARLTGLSEEYVMRSNLRIEATRFRKELLRAEGKTVGRYDSRFLGTDLDAVGERPEYDPSYAVVQGPFTALVNNYLRVDLNYDTDQEYRILTDKVQPWNYGSARNRYLNVAPMLRRAITKNPGMKVLVASGLYDLATPYFATRYTVNQLGLDPSLAGNVHIEEYPAGHMMYIHEASLRKQHADMAKFLREATTVSDASEKRR